ncbi:MAG: asparagine--tRNA ligase [Deltaproteobacteria bacterium]|nr:MAG: asparagine--tRNA ligase [Deltaproteobacteria bacterium]
MMRSKIAELLESTHFGTEVTVMGWVRTKRDSKGGFSFLEINDGSTIKNIQVIAEDKLANYTKEILRLTIGCSVIVKGILVESPGKGQKVEVQATDVKTIGWADPDTYPLQKKRHSFEYLRTIAHLRPRTNTFGAVARIRNAMSYGIHTFFQDRGFIYLHSPIITGSNCEGAGDMFTVTTLDLQGLKHKDGMVDFREDFFAKPASLTVSGQLEAEVYALALGNVYTFGPTFRAENSNTYRHLAEFWMVEPEMAFCDLKEAVDLAEEFVKSILTSTLTNCKDDLDFFNRFVDKDLISTVEHIIRSTFERLTYTEAIEILSQVRERFEFPVEWGKDIQSEHERYLCEVVFKRPVVVTDYPKEIKPFYMKVNKDGRTVKAMDILLPGVGEIIGGSQREDDYETLLNRIKEMNLDPGDYWWYLDLRRYGTVIHSGFGLGFERLIQFVTGLSNIRDAIPFPRTPKNLEF